VETRHAYTEASTVFVGEATDVSSAGYSIHTPERRYDLVTACPRSSAPTST